MGRWERWLFPSLDERRLAVVRIGVAIVLGIRIATGPYRELVGQPAVLFRPLSFMNFFGRMPSEDAVNLAQGLGLAAALLAAAGLLARPALALAWGSSLFLNGMATSIGKVVHNDVLLLLAAFPLLIAPHDTALAVRRGKSRSTFMLGGWAIRIGQIVIAFAYFFAGLWKLRNSGIGWVASDNLRWVLYASSDSGAVPNQIALFIADRPLVAAATAAFTLVVELGFPLVLVYPRSVWFFVPAAVAVHAGIWASMGLDYSAWIATVLIYFVAWERLFARKASEIAGR